MPNNHVPQACSCCCLILLVLTHLLSELVAIRGKSRQRVTLAVLDGTRFRLRSASLNNSCSLFLVFCTTAVRFCNSRTFAWSGSNGKMLLRIWGKSRSNVPRLNHDWDKSITCIRIVAFKRFASSSFCRALPKISPSSFLRYGLLHDGTPGER